MLPDMKDNSTTTPQQPDKGESDAEARKPYEAPTLVRWGTLHELTQAVGNSGSSDGGPPDQ